MKNALILFGGVSSEHDVSVVSAKSVIENTPSDKYNVIKVGITKDGRWFKYDGDVANLPDDKWLDDAENLTKAILSPTAATAVCSSLKKAELKQLKSTLFSPCFTEETARTVQFRAFCSPQAYPLSAVICSPPPAAWIRC